MKKNLILGLFLVFSLLMASCSSASKEEAAAMSALAGESLFAATDVNSLSIDSDVPTNTEEACGKSGKTITSVSGYEQTETSFSINMKYELDKCTEEADLTNDCPNGKKIDVVTDGTIDMGMSYDSTTEKAVFTMEGTVNIKAENLNSDCDIDLTVTESTGEGEFEGTFCGYSYEELNALINDESQKQELCSVIFG